MTQPQQQPQQQQPAGGGSSSGGGASRRSVNKAAELALAELEACPALHASPLTTPLFLCFNWNDVFEKYGFTDASSFYVVAFRSVRRKDVDEQALLRVNAAALDEARKSGGLLRYIQGKANAQRQCFEASIWESKVAADKAASRPTYADAMRVAATLYESYTLERYTLTATVDHLPAFKLIESIRKN